MKRLLFFLLAPSLLFIGTQCASTNYYGPGYGKNMTVKPAYVETIRVFAEQDPRGYPRVYAEIFGSMSSFSNLSEQPKIQRRGQRVYLAIDEVSTHPTEPIGTPTVPFRKQINLDLHQLEPGHYVLVVNGRERRFVLPEDLYYTSSPTYAYASDLYGNQRGYSRDEWNRYRKEDKAYHKWERERRKRAAEAEKRYWEWQRDYDKRMRKHDRRVYDWNRRYY